MADACEEQADESLSSLTAWLRFWRGHAGVRTRGKDAIGRMLVSPKFLCSVPPSQVMVGGGEVLGGD